MKLYLAFVNMMVYLTEAALEVFSPDHDTYPATGIQPFEGEPYHS